MGVIASRPVDLVGSLPDWLALSKERRRPLLALAFVTVVVALVLLPDCHGSLDTVALRIEGMASRNEGVTHAELLQGLSPRFSRSQIDDALSRLERAGEIELQEVSATLSSGATRTFYLYRSPR